jgi:hypothetical protein
MAQLYFHCSSTDEVLVDRIGIAAGDLAEARDHAACIVRSFVMALNPEDWRD